MAAPVFRFAPSPNGRLHLGHAFSALFTARAAKVMGGVFLLRIEDIDPVRSKPEFETGIFDDLQWLGLYWPQPVIRQSARMAAYRAAFEELRARGLVYPCFCSRHEIATAATNSDPNGAPLYTGLCRNLSKSEIAERMKRGDPVQWRLKMDVALAEVGPLMAMEAPVSGCNALWDAVTERLLTPARWGDVVLVRKETPTSYHLSVVVDDAEQGVTHVTRGMDLYAATDLHVLLQRLLGLPSPNYCHHQLLLDFQGQKLAKSQNSLSLESLRESGCNAEEVCCMVGFDF